jgi:hypothetical protein
MNCPQCGESIKLVCYTEYQGEAPMGVTSRSSTASNRSAIANSPRSRWMRSSRREPVPTTSEPKQTSDRPGPRYLHYTDEVYVVPNGVDLQAFMVELGLTAMSVCEKFGVRKVRGATTLSFKEPPRDDDRTTSAGSPRLCLRRRKSRDDH